QPGKALRPQAEGKEDRQRLSRLGEALAEMECLRCGKPGALASRLDRGKGEERRSVDVEGQEQDRARQAVGARIMDHEGQRNGAMKGEVEHEIEIAAEIARLAEPRQRAVHPVRKPACQNEPQTGKMPAAGDERGGRYAEEETGDRHA